MKHVLIAAVVVALAVPAVAGFNPNCKMFVHLDTDTTCDAYDNATVVNEILSPTAYTQYYAFIGLTECGVLEGAPPEQNGVKVASFAVNNIMADYPGVVGAQSFVNLLDLAIGDPWTGGITNSSIACRPAPFVLLGYVQIFYLTGGCTIEVVDHADYARWIVDCQEPGKVDYYCVWKQAGLGMVAPAGDLDCAANTLTEESTWGAIKAMYND